MTQFIPSFYVDKKAKIDLIIKKRNIKWLCHFTPRENLKNIKQNGLRLRTSTMKVTDENRADFSNNICLSISEPNKRMFYAKQALGFDLVLLLISPEVLYEKKCLFYPYNAATKSYRNQNIIQFSTEMALEDMFSETVRYQKANQSEQTAITRNNLMESCLTTTNQAEVQVIEDIDSKYIMFYFIDDIIPLSYSEIKTRLSILDWEKYKILFPNAVRRKTITAEEREKLRLSIAKHLEYKTDTDKNEQKDVLKTSAYTSPSDIFCIIIILLVIIFFIF